jgi:hypothetical protein
MKIKLALLGYIGTAFLMMLASAAAQRRGVTDTEIIIGTMTDLSGVAAVQGVNNAHAIRQAFNEVNGAFPPVIRDGRWVPVEELALTF